MTATIQVRVDGESKIKSPHRYMTEEELFSKLEISRKHAAEGSYKPADNMVAEMREKYSL